MLQKLKSRLPEGGLQLDPRVTLAGMAVIAAALAVAVAFYLWRDNGSFRPLHGAGESFPAAEVMQVLDGEALQYRIHPQSGQILVREDQLARARLLLNAKGVKVAQPAGYELFDKEEPLGTSQFVQDVRLKRSLEGELARTVMAPCWLMVAPMTASPGPLARGRDSPLIMLSSTDVRPLTTSPSAGICGTE